MARTYFQSFFELLHFVSLKGMNYGSANEPKNSGEECLIKELSKELKNNAVVFDVGSNNGQYLELLLKHLSLINPEIHCFEPDHKAFIKLKEKYGYNQRVKLNNFGLGDKQETLMLYSNGKADVKASLIKLDTNSKIQQEINVNTLDNYCNSNAIEKIDFLKIDTEGFEINVLLGANEMVSKSCIDRIQLEHGSIQTIMMNTSLYKIKQLLPNFKIYHLKQNGIRRIKYKPIFEIYYNSNYYFKRI